METQAVCACLEEAYVGWESEGKYLGTDAYYADISLQTCKRCGRIWLRYFYENEAFTKSGRWYRGVIPPEQIESITPENAKDFLGKLDWYLCGGSFFGRVFKARGVPNIWP